MPTLMMTGAEWKEFERLGWPAGYVWSDDSTLEDGKDLYPENGAEGDITISDAQAFNVPDYWHAVYEGPEGKPIDSGDGEGLSIRGLVRSWRKARDTQVVVVNVPKAEVEAFKALCRERKWVFA